MPVGSVYGPYLDLNSYKAVKLLGKKVVPDSVKARHILRRATDNAADCAIDRAGLVGALLEQGGVAGALSA